MKYVPLHVHTEYSLLDGATKIKDLVAICKENEMPACAITDHGVMYGAIDFYKTAKQAGIKPIIGCEVYVHDGDIAERNPNHNPCYHLILLAKNLDGYKNLIRLVSTANLEGMYYKPRINHELLEKYHENLICCSACLGGEVLQHLLHDEIDKAKEIVKWYKNLFGEDYYIELQDHNLPEQKKTNPLLISIAKEFDINLIITNDSHYNRPEDAKAHDILLCLQTKKDYDEPNRFRFPNNEFYIKNADELRVAFNWMDDETFNRCMQNTVNIADKCNLVFELGKTLLPNYPVPSGYTIETYLNKLVVEGMKKRYGEITPELDKRFKYELGVIERMGFAAYFLIVWDYINYSKTHNIPVGPGRGSAAGSLIAYALGITEIDPIKHGLMFERFLNPDRVSMPDVDVDFCIDKRYKVIDYVTEKYGEDKVCQIITFGTYAAKAAVKAVARTLKLDFTTSNNLTKMMVSGPKTHIDDSLKDGMPLKEEYDTKPEIKEIIDIAKSIEGLICNTGTHAAGVIIAKDPLIDSVPLQKSKEGSVVVTYPMSNIDDVGLLKMDFLGLKNLTVIQNAVDMIKERKGIELDMDHLPLDDKEIYEMLAKGDTSGIFQIESAGMKQMVMSMKASCFEDISAVLALYRPGPIEAKYPEKFVNRKLGREPIVYEHPLLESILKDTYGTMVYQEQIMKIVQVLAGFTMGEADKLRKAMGKKKVEIMEEYRPKFLDGSEKNGVDRTKANELYDNMTLFAQYCFNRAHTVCYAYITYETAFLKVHYPVEYFSALLTGVRTEQDKTQSYIAECQKIGIKVLPPDINASRAGFFPDGDNIRFGLGSVKNVGDAFLVEVEKEREKAPFEDMFDFCKRVKSCNKRTLESLIKVGAFSFTGKSRKQLFQNIDYIMERAMEDIQREESGQMNLFGTMEGMNTVELIGNEDEFSDSEIQMFEKDLLGFYVTSHPLSSIQEHLPFLTTHKIEDLKELKPDTPITVCGLLSSVNTRQNKKNQMFKVGTIEDLTGNVEFIMFSKLMQDYSDFVVPEAKVIISGKVQSRNKGDDDEGTTSQIVVDSVKPVQNTNIFTLTIKDKMKYEDIVALKDLLIKYKGSDPLVLNVEGHKILASSVFWVNATNLLMADLENNFPNVFEMDTQSIDKAS